MRDRWRLVGGVAIWLVAYVWLKLPLETTILLFAPLVLVPLGLWLIRTSPEAAAERALLGWIRIVQLPAAVLLAASFACPQGIPAAALAMAWLGVTGLLALAGLLRLWRLGWKLDGEAGITAALVFIAVGGGWAVVSRAGLRPQDFSHAIVLLTAVHFHYAGFALPLLAGLAVRESEEVPRSRVGMICDQIMLLSVIVGVPLVGVGISLSPQIEVVAAILLACGCLLMAVRQVQAAWREKNPTRLALASVSSLALVCAMGLAGVYAVGEFLGQPWLEIPTMIRTHGAFNAFGFAACGLAARMWSTRSASGQGEAALSNGEV